MPDQIDSDTVFEVDLARLPLDTFPESTASVVSETF